ncbi:MAG: hypothetical protein F4Y00_07365 [Bacteroidetes bacterium SB0662_bin_6]|nr:hypothetical protein [Bacteroidetes bacterium SB0662_bin_6]
MQSVRHIWRRLGAFIPVIFVAVCCLPDIVWAQETEEPERPLRFLQETPWTVSTPGALYSSMPVLAWWDFEAGRYYLDIADFFDRLGFNVSARDSVIEARDAGRIFTVDFATGRVLQDTSEPVELAPEDFFASEGRYYLALEGVQAMFTPASMQFDTSTLHIRLSTAMAPLASAFTARPAASGNHAHGPLLYGRSRQFLGNTHINYRLTRSDRQAGSPSYNGGFQVHSNALGGRLAAEGALSMVEGQTTTRFRSLNYLLDFPDSPLLKRAEIGRMSMYEWPVRTTYDGFRLSNMPLSTRYVQREAVVRGIAEPDAIIAASVGGVLADRVRADAQGRYTLRIPAYYGSSQALLEIAPPGGGPPTTITRHLFIGEDLLPPGAFWYDIRAGVDDFKNLRTGLDDFNDIQIGRDGFGDTFFGFGQARYGINRSLSAKATFIGVDSLMASTVGLTQNLWGFLTAGAELALPINEGGSAARVSMRMSFNRLRVQTEAEFSEESRLSFYKRRLQTQLSFGVRRMSLFLNAAQARTFSGGDNMSVSGSTTLTLPRRTSALVTVGLNRSQSALSSESVRMHWKATLTRAASFKGLRGRFGLQADGGVQEQADFAGATFYAYYKKVSLGLRAGYDLAYDNMQASVTLRLDAPWVSVNNHSSIESGNPYHRQSFYGSMELGRPMRFSRQAHMRSSALLQAYYDVDRDGRRDPEESLVEGLDIKVVKARVQRVDASVVRADFLAPSTAYQVVIDPASVPDPALQLPTGTTFSFMSDPGSTKRVNIPVHRNTIVQGVIEDLPLSSPTQASVIFFQGNEEVLSSEVSQEGAFSVLLPPGVYRLELRDVLGQEDLRAFARDIEVQEEAVQDILVRPF